MKKSIAMLLAVILLVSVIATAVAACSHTWKVLYSERKNVTKTETIAYQHGCIHLSNPHTHKRTYHTAIITTYYCPKCGKRTTGTTYTNYTEECPKH